MNKIEEEIQEEFERNWEYMKKKVPHYDELPKAEQMENYNAVGIQSIINWLEKHYDQD